MEAELIALSLASEEASWLRDLLSEIPMWEKPILPVLIHCDSTATIGRVLNKYYNSKSRYIRRKHSTVFFSNRSGFTIIIFIVHSTNSGNTITMN